MRILTVVLALALVQITSGIAWPQDAGQEQQQPLLGAAQLDQLVAPIALYPDPLLAQVLMASTYPLEVVQADRFAKTNKALKGDKLTQALDKQDWDASVKQLVSTPTVLAMMSDQLDWTEKLGDAVLAQQTDLMDAIQRLRGQAQANGKLGTTKQQKVTVSQEANKQVIEIEPASPEVAYVPYYNPSVVYGEWSYPDYPPYYYPPPAGYVVGGAIATGLAWGAAFAIGHQIWDNFDWNRGNINVNIDRNVNRNIDRNVNRNVDRNFQKWEHNSYHRRGVSYNSDAVKNKFSKGNARAAADRKLDYRGRKGDQVLNVGQGGQLGGGNRGERPTTKPSVGQLEQGLKDRSGKPKGKAAAKAKGGGGGNALDLRDGARAKDFSDRGKASLGNRGTKDFSRPSGGGPKVARSGGGGGHHVNRGGGNRPQVSRGGGGGHNLNRGGGNRPHVSRGGGGGGHISRGGGGRGGGGGGRGGGGRGGGGRRSDINLKQDIVPLAQLDSGLELYRFRYRDGDPTIYVGVMAQDVQKLEPSAVWRARDGYLRVDYDLIGVKFMTWKEWVARGGASFSSSP
ncbi:MAG: DUF3300 domain-containing protein [Methyloceanibacter sp.]